MAERAHFILRWRPVSPSPDPPPSSRSRTGLIEIAAQSACRGWSARPTKLADAVGVRGLHHRKTGDRFFSSMMVLRHPPAYPPASASCGFTTMPLSKRLTRRTCSACTSTERLRWRTPMPPCWAIAIAISASVTVSIADDRIGMLSVMSLCEARLHVDLRGITSDGAGLQQDIVKGQRFTDFHRSTSQYRDRNRKEFASFLHVENLDQSRLVLADNRRRRRQRFPATARVKHLHRRLRHTRASAVAAPIARSMPDPRAQNPPNGTSVTQKLLSKSQAAPLLWTSKPPPK